MVVVKRSRIIEIVVYLMLYMAASGCKNPDEQSVTLESVITATPTNPRAVEAVLTHTPEPTNTPYILPFFTPTTTMIPTLFPDQAMQAILDLYADNGGCQLPCWWGITPGITTWEETYLRLSPLGRVFGPRENTSGILKYDFEFIVPTYIDPWEYATPAIWVKDGVVRGISTNSGMFRNDFSTSLAGWLAQLGEPDEIWLDLAPISQTEPFYNMDLYYPTVGIIVHIWGDAIVTNKQMTICPQEFMQGQLFPPPILIWDPRVVVPYQTVKTQVFGGLITLNTENYSPLESLTTSLTSGNFYQTYLDPNTRYCFDIDVSTWLP